jgi:cobalamin synthase
MHHGWAVAHAWLKTSCVLYHAAGAHTNNRPLTAAPTSPRPTMSAPPTAALSTPAAASIAPQYADRVTGCLLGGMCGDVLGAAVEGWDAGAVLASCPDGCTDFLDTPRG